MNILQKKWEFLNSTIFCVPSQAKKLYIFGLATLCARSIVSLRTNARLVALNWHTAKSKIYRLTKNTKLLKVFPSLLSYLVLVNPQDTIAVDFSDFGNGFQVLLFAKQTQKGRTIPLYFEIIRYPIPRGSQNLFIIAAIRRFAVIIGFKPILVMDRGFAIPSLIQFLQENKYFFVIRIKKSKCVQMRNGRKIKVSILRHNDCIAYAYNKRLRIVISDQSENAAEPWYLITNNLTAERAIIIQWYYHRFEIEEFFRDAKRLLGLEWVCFKTSRSLTATLWFVILGVWCLWYLDKLLDKQQKDQRAAMRLSSIRFILEQLTAASFAAAEGQFFYKLST